MIGRLFKWLLVLLLVVVVALGGVFTWLVVRGFPQRDGTVRLAGLSAPVRVVRDKYGIANIYAATSDDLFAAQGWVHASERMWQMEVWRHIGAGRLAELFGDSQVPTDSYVRTLGWRVNAEASLEEVSAEGRAALDAYSRGVNAWLDTHSDLPLPFVITGLQGAGGGLAGYRPEHWTPLDTLTWQKVQAWSLGDNMGTELTRMMFRAHGLSDAQIAELSPPYDMERPIIVETPGMATELGTATGSGNAAGDAVRQTPPTRVTATTVATAAALLANEERLRSWVGLATGGPALAGSNGFAVAPSRSATGGALLANDPHLDLGMPSLWFLVGLHCEPVGPACPYEMAGAGFPGVPGLVLGHNARIAWGLTNVGPDVQDLFEETVDPADSERYLYKGRSLPFDVRTETIEVSGGDDIELTIRSTVHGPVMSDVDSDLLPLDEDGLGLARDGHVYALAWTGSNQADRTLDSVLAINRAANWEEFRAAARDFGAPSQTLLYADVDGHIGVQIPGLIPIRGQGDGSAPVPGETGDYDWTGFIPFADLPYSFDPPSGVIVAANNLPADPAAGFIGRDFDPGYRAARITELLAVGGRLTTEDLRVVQSDTKLTRAAAVLAIALELEPGTDDGRVLRQQLRDWTDTLGCTTESTGCAAYETFEYWLSRGVLEDELGGGDGPTDGARRYVGSEIAHEFLTRLVDQPESAWWDDTSTADVVETRDEIIATAMDRAAADLRAVLGEPSGWTWGRIHTITFEEQSLGSSGIGPLEWIFNKGPFPAPGSCTTINKQCGRVAEDWPAPGDTPDLQLRFDVRSGPSYRLVIDMSDLDGATIIQTTGQSGLPFDTHYGDFIERWLANVPLPLPWSTATVEAARVQELTLTP